jgi:hypothetical protein
MSAECRGMSAYQMRQAVNDFNSNGTARLLPGALREMAGHATEWMEYDDGYGCDAVAMTFAWSLDDAFGNIRQKVVITLDERANLLEGDKRARHLGSGVYVVEQGMGEGGNVVGAWEGLMVGWMVGVGGGVVGVSFLRRRGGRGEMRMTNDEPKLNN